MPGAAGIWAAQPTTMGFTVMKPGSMFTGMIFIRTGLPWKDVAFWMAHESVHKWMTRGISLEHGSGIKGINNPVVGLTG